MRPPARLEELFAFAFLSCSASVSAEDREVHDGICRAGNWSFVFYRSLNHEEEMNIVSFQTCLTLFVLWNTRNLHAGGMLFSSNNDTKHHRTATITIIK